MGSVRDNDTRTKFLAENLLLPQALIRAFTVCAKFGDKERFRSLLKDQDTRKVLLASFRVFFWKPELFVKAIAILLAPRLYFMMRRDKD